MKMRLPKGLLALIAAIATNSAYAGYYTPTTITTEGIMQLGTKADEVGGYTIDAKDGIGTATITGDVTSGSAIYVREGELIIGGTDYHNTVTINTQGGGQHRQGDSPTMLSVAGKNSVLTIDNATVTSNVEVATTIGGADGNGSLTIQNGGKYVGSNQDYFFIGYQSYRTGSSTPLSPHVQIVHATTQGALGKANSDNTDLENRFVGEYSDGANGAEFGRGVVTVTGNSEFVATGIKEFALGHGELNILENSSFASSSLPVLLGFSVGCTSTVNVESGSVMNINGQLHTGSYKDSKIEINVTNATLNLNNYKGAFLGLGSETTYDYVDNGSVTEVNLNEGAVMNVTEEMYVGYRANANVNVAATATINDSGDSRDRMIICDAGCVENAGTIELDIVMTGGQLTAHDGAEFADITALGGTINVDGSITVGSLTLGEVNIAAAEEVAVMTLATADEVQKAVQLVLSQNASINATDVEGLDNAEIIIVLDNYTAGDVLDSGHQYIVGADGETKVTIKNSAGEVVATNVDIRTVPEPATATLSLLALAALAARRRRK